MSVPDDPSFPDDTPLNSAEPLDGEVLGEEPGDEELPGVNAYTDQTILNSEDPAVIMGGSETEDNLRTRVWREVPDIEVSEDGGFRLVDTAVDPAETAVIDSDADTAIDTEIDTEIDTAIGIEIDGEEQLAADVRAVTEPSAEEAATRVEKR